MARLILTVGLPRSGKSSWAKSTGHPIVNPDSIRLALHGQRFLASAEPLVWAMAFLMVEALFLAGNEIVIVDATNTTEKRRKEWQSRYENVELKVFNTSPEICIERAKQCGHDDLIPVIERMAAAWDLDKPWETEKYPVLVDVDNEIWRLSRWEEGHYDSISGLVSYWNSRN